jgi:hypothetical protein
LGLLAEEANPFQEQSYECAEGIRVTRDLIRAGQLLKIDLCDHVIMGNGKHVSLRRLGYLPPITDNAGFRGDFLQTLRNRPFFVFATRH